MTRRRTRVLFAPLADADIVTSQNLSARDIALHLDPERFSSTFFHTRPPDPRLVDRPHVRLVRLPRRWSSPRIVRELLWGPHDVHFYLQYGVQPETAARGYRTLRRLGRRKPIVATVEITAEQLRAAPERHQAEYLAGLRQADAVFAVSDRVRDSFREAFGLELPERTIPLGVDLDRFPAADRSHHRPPWRILFVGHIDPRKQPHLILDLARRLAAPVEFHLLGAAIHDPAYGQRLERERSENVHFHGVLPPDEVAAWMAKADVFLLPSRLEGLPRVTLEAAASGLPCVVFDDYRTPSVVDGVTGFQVRDLESMLERLQSLLADRDLRRRLGAAAAEHARRFAWRRVVRHWEEILQAASHR